MKQGTSEELITLEGEDFDVEECNPQNNPYNTDRNKTDEYYMHSKVKTRIIHAFHEYLSETNAHNYHKKIDNVILNPKSICIIDILNFVSRLTDKLQVELASDGKPYLVGHNGTNTYLRYSVAEEFDQKLTEIIKNRLHDFIAKNRTYSKYVIFSDRIWKTTETKRIQTDYPNYDVDASDVIKLIAVCSSSKEFYKDNGFDFLNFNNYSIRADYKEYFKENYSTNDIYGELNLCTNEEIPMISLASVPEKDISYEMKLEIAKAKYSETLNKHVLKKPRLNLEFSEARKDYINKDKIPRGFGKRSHYVNYFPPYIITKHLPKLIYDAIESDPILKEKYEYYYSYLEDDLMMYQYAKKYQNNSFIVYSNDNDAVFNFCSFTNVVVIGNGMTLHPKSICKTMFGINSYLSRHAQRNKFNPELSPKSIKMLYGLLGNDYTIRFQERLQIDRLYLPNFCRPKFGETWESVINKYYSKLNTTLKRILKIPDIRRCITDADITDYVSKLTVPPNWKNPYNITAFKLYRYAIVRPLETWNVKFIKYDREKISKWFISFDQFRSRILANESYKLMWVMDNRFIEYIDVDDPEHEFDDDFKKKMLLPGGNIQEMTDNECTEFIEKYLNA